MLKLIGARDQQLVTWSKDQSLRIWKVDTTMQKVYLISHGFLSVN